MKLSVSLKMSWQGEWDWLGGRLVMKWKRARKESNSLN